jgi:hypothetical protein
MLWLSIDGAKRAAVCLNAACEMGVCGVLSE